LARSTDLITPHISLISYYYSLPPRRAANTIKQLSLIALFKYLLWQTNSPIDGPEATAGEASATISLTARTGPTPPRASSSVRTTEERAEGRAETAEEEGVGAGSRSDATIETSTGS
jgi:hypothetical protein